MPQGHSGAIYGPEPGAETRTDKAQTKGQDDFHNALHDAFNRAADFGSMKAEVLAVVERFAWKEEAPGKPIHQLATYQGATLTPEIAKQKYQAVVESITTAFAGFGV